MPTYQEQLAVSVGNVHAVMRLVRRDKPPWPQIAAAIPGAIYNEAVTWERLARQAIDPAHAWDDPAVPPLPQLSAADLTAALSTLRGQLDSLQATVANPADVGPKMLSLIRESLGPVLLTLGVMIVAGAYPGVESACLDYHGSLWRPPRQDDVMNRLHVFNLDRHPDAWMGRMALGDTAVNVIAVDGIIRKYDLDAIIIPNKNPHFTDLWQRAFGSRLVQSEAEIPESHRHASFSRPTRLDGSFAEAGWNIFEQVWWELGFFHTEDLYIVPPILYHCDVSKKAVMVYPFEKTDGNRVYTMDWWRDTLNMLRGKGYSVNVLGREDRCKMLVASLPVTLFPETTEGLAQCIAASSLAIGSSTGPTWACLMSDIPQIVLDSHRQAGGCWFFDRIQKVLAKHLRIAATVESFLL